MPKGNLLILVLILSVLSGCATMGDDNPQPIKVVTQKVEVPIAVSCKEDTPPPPKFCFNELKESANILEKTKCLLSDRKLRIAYELQLNAALAACKR